MASYRFCRPDDIPRLVAAVNTCFNVHFPDLPLLTVEAFRAEMKALDVWPSSSMVALDETGPVAVLIGTKRERDVLVHRIGVRPDCRRRGHGLHLLTSLSRKLAVLGPDRVIAEVPADLPGVSELLAAAGYRREATFTDWVRRPSAVEAVPEAWVVPVTVGDLVEQEALATDDDVAWVRRPETLRNRRDELEGFAVVSPERLEAFVLVAPPEGRFLDVVACRCRDPGGGRERAAVLLDVLLRFLAARADRPLRLPRLAENEVPAPVLERLGFAATVVHERHAGCIPRG